MYCMSIHTLSKYPDLLTGMKKYINRSLLPVLVPQSISVHYYY